jgi:AcrR family transcriptional regulator
MARRAGLTPDRVVGLALEILDRDGPDGLTLARVAEAAGVATPSLYKHIGGLADLRERICVQALAELTARLPRVLVGVSGDDAIRAFADAYRGYVRNYPARVALLVPPTQLPDPADNPVTMVLAVLRGYGLTGSDAIHAARTLRSAVHGFVVLEAGGGFGLPEDLDESFRRLVDVVIAGLHAPARQ